MTEWYREYMYMNLCELCMYIYASIKKNLITNLIKKLYRNFVNIYQLFYDIGTFFFFFWNKKP